MNLSIDRRGFVLGAAAGIAASAFPPATVHASTNVAAVEGEARHFMAAYGVPGLSIAVARKGVLLHAVAFGFADSARGERLTPRHRLRIASISKPITATAVFTLIENGQLALDQRVFSRDGVFGGSFRGAASQNNVEQITIGDLLTHTAGGWANDRNDPMFKRTDLDAWNLIAWALREFPIQQPGITHAYSNFGYCILGRVIERVTGQSYSGYVRQNVLGRMGINDMDLAGNQLAERKPLESLYYGQQERAYDMNVRRMDAHGGWIASAASLARFASSVDGYPQILAEDTVRMMTMPSRINAGYASGWSINRANNWWHTGSLPGSCSIMVRANSGVCFAALANTRRPRSKINGDLDRLMWRIVAKLVPTA